MFVEKSHYVYRTHRKLESLVLPAFLFYYEILYNDRSQNRSREMPKDIENNVTNLQLMIIKTRKIDICIF